MVWCRRSCRCSDRLALAVGSCRRRCRARRSRAAAPGRRGARLELGAAASALAFSAQTTTDGPGARQRNARLARDGPLAQLAEERRVGAPERLVQAVVEGARRAAPGRREAMPAPSSAAWAAAAAASSCRMNSGQAGARLARVHAGLGHDHDRRERQVLGEPPDRVTARRRARSGRRRPGAPRRGCRRGPRAAARARAPRRARRPGPRRPARRRSRRRRSRPTSRARARAGSG